MRHFQQSKLCLVLNMSARSSTLYCKCKVHQLLFYVIYFFLYSSPGEYLFKHIYVISKGGLTKGVICLALLGYFHASLSSSLSLSGSSSSLLAEKVVDSSIGPSPCLFRRRHALVCFYVIAWPIHLNIYLDLFSDICVLLEMLNLGMLIQIDRCHPCFVIAQNLKPRLRNVSCAFVQFFPPQHLKCN